MQGLGREMGRGWLELGCLQHPCCLLAPCRPPSTCRRKRCLRSSPELNKKITYIYITHFSYIFKGCQGNYEQHHGPTKLTMPVSTMWETGAPGSSPNFAPSPPAQPHMHEHHPPGKTRGSKVASRLACQSPTPLGSPTSRQLLDLQGLQIILLKFNKGGQMHWEAEEGP